MSRRPRYLGRESCKNREAYARFARMSRSDLQRHYNQLMNGVMNNITLAPAAPWQPIDPTGQASHGR